jgi:D-xylose transport system substrate-binding protein
MKKILLSIGLLLSMTMVFSLPAHAKKIVIGVSLPTQRDERWVRDAQKMKDYAKEHDIDLKLQISDNDAARQMAQCENLLAQGIDILLIAPHDASSASAIVDSAHQAGIKVISYDRLVLGTNLDLYVSFDNFAVGRLQGEYLVSRVPKGNYAIFAGAPTDNNAKLFRDGAMSVIKPYVDRGDVKIVADQWIADWQPSAAMNLMQNALTATNNKIDAVLAPNDNTAGGMITALEQAGLAGKIPVTGQDAEVTGAKRILKGTQSMTVFKDTRALATAALDAAVLLASGKDAGATSKVNNKAIDVPAILLTPVVVDQANLTTVLVDSGYLKKQDVE